MAKKPNTTETITAGQLAKRWGKSRWAIWSRINSGELVPLPNGPQDDKRKKRFRLVDIERLEKPD